MRKTPVVALGLLAALSLAACSSSDGGASPSASGAAGDTNQRTVEVEGSKVTIEGKDGAAPILRFDKPLEIKESTFYPVSKGSGNEKLTEGQLLGVNYSITSASDGSQQYSTWQEGQPIAMILSKTSMQPEMYNAFDGASIHAQLMQSIPASANSPTAALAYLEVESAQTIPTRAEGKSATPPATMPQVKVDKDGKPSVTMPKGDPPKELQKFTTIEGSGDFVDAGNSVAVNYTGWLWDGKQFDSSWDRGAPFAFTLGASQVIPGWDEGLAKQKVGSQVLLVIPPDKGYGDTAQGDIPAGSTLVFVIDILGKV